MKKITALLVCIIMILTAFTACSPETAGEELAELNGKTPTEIYDGAVEALKTATSYEVSTSQVITMEAGEQDITINQLVVTKINGDNSYFKSTNDLDASSDMEGWWVDGILYAQMAGVKAKQEITKEEYMEQYMGVDASESTLLDIPESWFVDIKFQPVDDEYKIEFVVSGEKYNELLENAGLSVVAVDGDVVYSVFFDKDGNIQRITTVFDMTSMGVLAHCDSESTVKIGSVEITAPEDADSYQWVN